ncbi:LysE family translocator [Natrialbaceae archaeon GCM10025810]|uniref:LysE family translocator n=1 Tax=Halovalidus salilacus TaxID=3075124 RepID=UPI0036141DD4
MTALLATALAGVVFGIALAAPPGPMNAIIAEESVLRGWDAGFKAGLGAMSADAIFFVLALAGAVTVVARTPVLETALYVVGGLLMLYFALGAILDARTAAAFTDDVEDDSTGFRKAFVLSLTNPYQIGFWLTVGVGLLKPGTVDVLSHLPAFGDRLAGALVVETGSPALLVGFFGGILLWIVVFPATLSTAGRRVDALAPIIAFASGLVLAGFGLFFLTEATAGVL